MYFSWLYYLCFDLALNTSLWHHVLKKAKPKPPGNILSHGILTTCKIAHASSNCQVGSISSSSHSTHLQSNKLKQLFRVASKLASIRTLTSRSWGRLQQPWPASLGDSHHPWPHAHHLYFSLALGTKSWPELYHRYLSPALFLALPPGWEGTPPVKALPSLLQEAGPCCILITA